MSITTAIPAGYNEAPRRGPSLSVLQVMALLAAAQSPFERALASTAYSTGIRLSDLGRLKLSGVDWEWKNLLVPSPNGKANWVVDLDAGSVEAIHEYQAWRPSRNGWLFEDNLGQPLPPKTIKLILNTLAQRAGLGHIRGNALRRARALHLLARINFRGLNRPSRQ